MCVCVCVYLTPTNTYVQMTTITNTYVRTYTDIITITNTYTLIYRLTFGYIHIYIHTNTNTHTHTRADIHNLHACVSTNTQFQHFITDKTQSQVNVPCFQGMHESDMSETRTLSECFHFEIAGYI